MIFKNDYVIGMEDIGRGNQATNLAILTMMEDVGSLHSASVGYGVMDIERRMRAWVILDWKVTVVRRPYYNETIHAATWASKLDRACAYRDFELTDESGELVAVGTSRWVLMDLTLRRPVRLAGELAGLFEMEEDKNALPEEENHFRDLLNPDELTILESKEYKMERRDIDINGHMHNLSYLDVAYEMLPQKVFEQMLQQGECNHIRIQYKKEIRSMDHVLCEYAYIDGKHYLVMKVEDRVHTIVALY